MEKLLAAIPCLSERNFSFETINKAFFDGKEDKRYLDSSIRKFISLNKDMLDFLSLDAEYDGIGTSINVTFKTEQYVGAVPIRMPYDGIAHKDLQILPNYTGRDTYEKLTQLLGKLEYSISPEYLDGFPLNLPTQLKSPMYIESIKYIELFEKALKQKWHKFDTTMTTHNFPKPSTQWSKYAAMSALPENTLRFPSRDNILSVNHQEWQQLVYAVNVAIDDINMPSTPLVFKYGYRERINRLKRNCCEVPPYKCDHVHIYAGDPTIIKELKAQANVILKKTTASCMAWRMDISVLFERYVQHILSLVAKRLGGRVYSNHKITGSGSIPSWGLKYLEPDVIVRVGDTMIMCDAKYKSHFMNRDSETEKLKDSHRHDLHQLLAYCAFSPARNKIGMLVYPAMNSISPSVISYHDNIAGVTNKVFIVGLPFDADKITDCENAVFEVINSNLDNTI